MPRKLSNGNHVRRFLQLDRLLIDEVALVVDDHVGIERAVLRLARGGGSERGETVRNVKRRERGRQRTPCTCEVA
jgi:hypothetical protein